jgi:hypothetical protein
MKIELRRVEAGASAIAPLNSLLLAACAFLAGCGNYDFRDAEEPDGKLDFERLKGDLESKRGEPLVETSWFPLVRLSAIGFRREPSIREAPPDGGEPGAGAVSLEVTPAAGGYPPGYVLQESRGYGPLFIYASSRSSRFDMKGEGFEVRESQSVLWRLWSESRSLVKTLYGNRVESRQALLFGLIPLPVVVTYHRQLLP